MEKNPSVTALDVLEEALRRKLKETGKRKVSYAVPSVWTQSPGRPTKVKVDPFRFFLDAVKHAKREKAPGREGVRR